jgi:hypothetical protein
MPCSLAEKTDVSQEKLEISRRQAERIVRENADLIHAEKKSPTTQ